MEAKPDQQPAAGGSLEAPEDGQAPKPETDDQSTAVASQTPDTGGKPGKQPSGIKTFFKKVNIYLLAFVLIVIIAGAVTIVSYLNGKKAPPAPEVATQELNEDVLKQLANSDATVGGSGQTLTVQGNAIFSGQILAKQDLGVSGTIQAGAGIVVPQITVSGQSNLAEVQINSLQVANNTTMQGILTLQRDLNVAGSAAFNGPVTIGQLTVNRLIMSGNASLQIPNHISFPGASPGRTVNPSVLGAGGTASVSGSDTTGTINISTGNGTVPGCFATVNFNQRFTSTPHVLVSPVGAGAGQTQFYTERSATGFSICTANAAPTGQAFAFDYFVTQ
jgi:hypothetical protein